MTRSPMDAGLVCERKLSNRSEPGVETSNYDASQAVPQERPLSFHRSGRSARSTRTSQRYQTFLFTLTEQWMRKEPCLTSVGPTCSDRPVRPVASRSDRGSRRVACKPIQGESVRLDTLARSARVDQSPHPGSTGGVHRQRLGRHSPDSDFAGQVLGPSSGRFPSEEFGLHVGIRPFARGGRWCNLR
jgi:hypothetical protein